MTKLDIAAAIAEGEDLSKRQATRIIERFLHECQVALERGERVTLPPFGTFVVRERKAREGRNPKTGDAIALPERKAVVFVAAQGLKNAVGGKSKRQKAARGKDAAGAQGNG